jgi:phosphatidylglycerophosphate synthase
MVRAGLRANQVTLLALIIGLFGCVWFALSGRPLLFAGLLLVGGYFDTLDGAVARLRNAPTRVGGYLDAVSDRLFDASVLFVLALRSGHWPLCMLVAVASYSVSYTKARAALEAPASNLGWPHAMGREERVIALVLTIALWAIFPDAHLLGADVLEVGLYAILAGLVLTTITRVRYAITMLAAVDQQDPRP